MAKQAKKVASTQAAPAVAPEAPATQAPAPEQAAPATQAPAKMVRYAARNWGSDWVVTTLVNNPKRPGSKSHARWAACHGPAGSTQTVAQYVKAVGNATLANADLRWGMAPQRGFYRIDPPQAAAQEA